MAEVHSPYRETDPRTLGVLCAALESPGRAVRLRAVAMLALVDCPKRERWLERAARDTDPAVRETALIVQAWVHPVAQVVWPDREGVVSVMVDAEDPEQPEFGGIASEWAYTVEVWRTDGFVVGSYFVTTCTEDDSHARSLALGHAILESTRERADAFDPEHAATFVVEKRQRRRGTTKR